MKVYKGKWAWSRDSWVFLPGVLYRVLQTNVSNNMWLAGVNADWVLEFDWLGFFNRLLFNLEDILLNSHKTNQDLGKTVSWHPEDLLVFLVHMWVERSWIPGNITEFPLHKSTIQVKLVMLTRKKYFLSLVCAQWSENVFVIHHKLQQVIFYPHNVVLKSKYKSFCSIQIC